MANPNMIVGKPSVNPLGRPKNIFQDLSPRRAHFMETLSRGEILDIASNDKKLDKYSSFDAMVLLGLAEALTAIPEEKIDPYRARESLYDRVLGKASQPIDVAINVTLSSRLDKLQNVTCEEMQNVTNGITIDG